MVLELHEDGEYVRIFDGERGVIVMKQRKVDVGFDVHEMVRCLNE
jgi:hypothetical protein